jgi:transposase
MEFLMSKKTEAWFVGIDLHKDTMTVCAYCPSTGKVVYTKIPCRCRKKVREFFQSLPRPHIVAIETVGFYRWLWRELEPVVEKLVLADATATRALAARRLKTDREDAFNVAELLALGRLPQAYAPTTEVQILRDLTRHRNGLARQHARVLHRVHSILLTNNRPGPQRMESDGLARYIKAFGDQLPTRHVDMLWKYVDQLGLTERQIEQAEREIAKCLEWPVFQATAEILDSFSGVAMVAAATILAEVGDFHRFTYRKAIARFAGLNPRVFASGEKQRIGHIAKAGSRNLRWILQQVAWTAIRTDPHVKHIFLRIRRRAGSKAAAVAIARKMLTWMWYAVREGKKYQGRSAA